MYLGWQDFTNIQLICSKKMKNFKLKFSEYIQNISRSKSFGKFVLIVYTFKISLHCVFLRSMSFLACDNTALSRKKAAGKIYKNQLNFQTSTFIYQCSDSPNFLFYGDSCWSIKVVLYNYLSDGFFQRSYQRWFDKRIYKTEMKIWAVLGSRGCREKNLPTAISMQLFGVFFSTF